MASFERARLNNMVDNRRKQVKTLKSMTSRGASRFSLDSEPTLKSGEGEPLEALILIQESLDFSRELNLTQDPTDVPGKPNSSKKPYDDPNEHNLQQEPLEFSKPSSVAFLTPQELVKPKLSDRGLASVGIFWDLESFPMSVKSINQTVHQLNALGSFHGDVNTFRAYANLDSLASDQVNKLLMHGVMFRPVEQGKDSIVKAIIMEAVLFAIDNEVASTCIILISSDGGFGPMLGELSIRNVRTIVIGKHKKDPSFDLVSAATETMSWTEMMFFKARKVKAPASSFCLDT